MRDIKFRAWVANAHGDWMAQQGVHPEIDTAGKFLAKYEEHIVMQYTGLKDKNGVEIYEGDIITHPYLEILSPVEWDNDTAGFIAGGTYLSLSDKEREVIGNIYENKELLK